MGHELSVALTVLHQSGSAFFEEPLVGCWLLSKTTQKPPLCLDSEQVEGPLLYG